MPRASESNAVVAKPGVRLRLRTPTRMLLIKLSISPRIECRRGVTERYCVLTVRFQPDCAGCSGLTRPSPVRDHTMYDLQMHNRRDARTFARLAPFLVSALLLAAPAAAQQGPPRLADFLQRE